MIDIKDYFCGSSYTVNLDNQLSIQFKLDIVLGKWVVQPTMIKTNRQKNYRSIGEFHSDIFEKPKPKDDFGTFLKYRNNPKELMKKIQEDKCKLYEIMINKGIDDLNKFDIKAFELIKGTALTDINHTLEDISLDLGTDSYWHVSILVV